MDNNIKEEMQFIVKKCLNNSSKATLNECLNVYKKTFGEDEFYCTIKNQFQIDYSSVAVICIDASDDELTDFLQKQTYENIEIIKMETSDTFKDIYEYVISSKNSYVTFLESSREFSPNKIFKMVKYVQQHHLDVLISSRKYIDMNNEIVAHPFVLRTNDGDICKLNGKAFFEYCIQEKINMCGSLSNLLVSVDYLKKLHFDDNTFECNNTEISSFSFLSELILNATIGYINEPLVSVRLTNKKDGKNEDTEKYLNEYIDYLKSKGKISVQEKSNNNSKEEAIRRHITFFYTDKGEYYNLKPIADEALRRGFEIEFTQNIKQKAEIGIYCQHVCYPENSKFSLILLHDMAQGHNRWPNIWEIERWNKFDMGIVPGKDWAERWEKCAFHPYTNPRLGTFQLGYPKSDLINSQESKMKAEKLRNQYNLKHDFSVLYAPSWENDEKEDDFIRALVTLPINLIIKQAHWPQEYSHIIKNIEDMRSLHDGKYENVYYIEPEESIMTALELCDMVVSDESSVMTEAILYDKPSVAVIDWLIPDTVPSRFASVPMDYVLKCKKVELREYVEKLYFNKEVSLTIRDKYKNIFSNQGNCCKDILDAIEYYTQSKPECGFLEKKCRSLYSKSNMWN